MRTSRIAALLAVLVTAPVAKAADADVVAAPAAAQAPTAKLPWLGLMADAGIPDGFQGSLVLRPTSGCARAWAAATT